MPGFIQGMQFMENESNKIFCLEEGDYSYFDHFCSQVEIRPAHLPEPRLGMRDQQNIDIIDIGQ